MKTTAWLSRHHIELRLGLRITIAGVLAFAFVHLLELKQGYWAVLTAVIVVQANVGGSLKAASDRLIGTLAGGAYGVAIVTVVPQEETIWRGAGLVLALLPLAIAAAFRPGLRVAPVTAIIVLLGATTQSAGALPSVIERVIEIGMGSAIAFAVSLLVLPTRAHAQLAASAASTLDLLADMVPVLLDGRGRETSGKVHDMHKRLRSALGKLEVFADEARRERASLLSGEDDPEPVLRTIRRLRHDLIMVDRATRDALPKSVAAPLRPSLASVSSALEAALRGLAGAFRERRLPPPVAAFHDSLTTYHEAMAGVRRAGLTRAMPVEATALIFGLTFALDQISRDLDDLTSRAEERAGKRKPQPAPVT